MSSGFLSNVPMYLGLLANAHMKDGTLAEAEHAVKEALSVQARTHETYSLPDLMSTRAKVLAARGRQDLAEVVLHEALEKSVEMAARSLQLRVACDLADLWIAQGRAGKAVELLGPIYEEFSEGHGTKDLLRAASLLAAMRLVNCGETPVQSGAPAR
jgi:predicted ATPase